jgi:proline iminopeptidase
MTSLRTEIGGDCQVDDRSAHSTWIEHRLVTPDLGLAWYEAGSGPALLFVSGGPGDDHRYLRSVAQPLLAHFRCVLFDQRGTGASVLDRLDERTLHVDRFLDDLEALRRHLGPASIHLMGHSWGATLALLYCARYPRHVQGAALVGMGPLTEELAAVARVNLLHPLSPAERATFNMLAARRRAALQSGDLEAHGQAHVELVTTLSVRSWFYSPEVAGKFAEQFRASYAHNPLVGQYVLPSVDYSRLWAQLAQITSPLLVLYGYQDFEPVVQAYLLKERVPQTRVCLLNECGHVPWLEQPAAFYGELLAFLLAA